MSKSITQDMAYPAEIEFKLPKDKMFGYYISELKSSVSFLKKQEFIEKAELFNSYRVGAVHRMRRTNLDTLAVELQKVKGCFDEIFDLYNDIQDDFRVIFHSLQKDTFVEYLTDKGYDEYFG